MCICILWEGDLLWLTTRAVDLLSLRVFVFVFVFICICCFYMYLYLYFALAHHTVDLLSLEQRADFYSFSMEG